MLGPQQRPLISGCREIDDGTSLLFADSLGSLDAIDPRAEAYVHQYEIGMQFRALFDRVLPGSRAAGRLIAESLDRVLDVEGDDPLVLDDQYSIHRAGAGSIVALRTTLV